MAKDISRRSFIIKGALALGAAATTDINGIGNVFAASEGAARVYFTEELSGKGTSWTRTGR